MIRYGARCVVWAFASKKSLFAAEQERPDVAARRYWWKAYQNKLDPTRLVFLDETWVKTNMAPIRGWCAKGERLKAYAPHGHWKTMTFLAALRCSGMEAPCVFDGPINAERFTAWVKEMLCPTLKQGDIVIMDNLSSHKNAAVREAIRDKGARLFVPASILP